MFITENTSVNDSALFYGFMREALIEQIGDNKEVVSFLESASDTDIISYATLGCATPADIDAGLYEMALMSEIKNVLLDEAESFDENYSLSEFIQEIGSLNDIDSKDVLNEASLWDKIKGKQTPSSGVSGDFTPTDSGTATGEKSLQAFLSRQGAKAANAWNTVKDFVKTKKAQGAGKYMGAAALVAAASFISYKVYQNYFSKAAKACAGKTGAAKTACMAKVKSQATKARIASLKKGLTLASQTSNPAKVRASISAKLNKLKG